jgi:hypothetical protein
MLDYVCVVADESLCVIGDVLYPYTRRGVLPTPHGHYGFCCLCIVSQVVTHVQALFWKICDALPLTFNFLCIIKE